MSGWNVDARCPNCEGAGMEVFYNVSSVPVHSMVLHRTRDEAVQLQKGDIELAHCKTCGFIGNMAFDERLVRYDAAYESTQRHSDVFSAFHRDLARRLVERYDLSGKTVIEIGCGQGEFLALLCEYGNCRGLGFDPAYAGGVARGVRAPNVEVIADRYGEAYADRSADLVCCKMTLEHIPRTAEFVRTVRRSIGERRDCAVFFQVPSIGCTLEEIAFWDIYYEHCSYFSPKSLTHVFRHNGYDVMESRVEYDDQYLMIEARPSSARVGTAPAAGVAGIDRELARFVDRCDGRRSAWQANLKARKDKGLRTVLWGGGSKAVGFLTTLGIGGEVAGVVDINPNKHGTFLPGTGHEVIAPEQLGIHGADVVLVMNPIYMNEVREKLRSIGVDAELMAVTDPL